MSMVMMPPKAPAAFRLEKSAVTMKANMMSVKPKISQVRKMVPKWTLLMMTNLETSETRSAMKVTITEYTTNQDSQNTGVVVIQLFGVVRFLSEVA